MDPLEAGEGALETLDVKHLLSRYGDLVHEDRAGCRPVS